MGRNRIAIELAVVAVIASAALGFGIQRAGIASGYVDPFLHAGAQDEAVYGHAAANMVRTGRWLTPIFLERFMLNKPPLLMWTGAISMRLFGVNPTALRLPAIVAGVLCCVFVYSWLRHSRTVPVACAGVLLLLGNALFHSMARRFMTDILLALLITAAMFLVAFDPRLERSMTAVGFGILSGAAILTKSAAGFIPLLILIVYYFLSRSDVRPALNRIALTFAVAVLVAAPWHIYQWLVHRDWFVAEYIRFQLLGSGISAPSRYTAESTPSFYIQRLVALDPLLLLLCCVALPGIVAAWKRPQAECHTRLLTAWCLCSFGCLLLFGTRVAYYLLPLIPAMALMSSQFSPLLRGRWAAAVCALLTLAFALKAWQGTAAWGLDYQHESVPSAAALEKYSRLRRANELLIVSPDDEFYSSILDLPRLRYVYLGTVDPTKTSSFFYWLGVNVSVPDFCNLPTLLPVYGEHLAAWRFPDTKPVGTIISAGASADLPAILRCSPDRDFFLPDGLREQALNAARLTHVATESRNGRFFLLARNSQRRPQNSHQTGAIIAPEMITESAAARTLGRSPPPRALSDRFSKSSPPYPERSSP